MEKNKILLIALVFVLLIISGVLIFINASKVALKNNTFTYEYGDVINADNLEILATNDAKILETLKVDMSDIKLEENKDFPSVGEYEASVSYKEGFRNKSKDITIIIEDTTGPDFIGYPEVVEIEINDARHNFRPYFLVEDLSDFELELDTTAVNFAKTGQYTAKAIATDIYGNESIQEFNVSVVDTRVENPAPIYPTIKNGILIVNKKHPLPASYSPGEDPIAVAQLKELIADMQELGFDIGNAYSGFRTYDHQKNLYEAYVRRDGRAAADTYSARPGHSEHQTGLTFDVKHYDGSLVTKQAEAKWIAENAASYGFIVRYQAGKEEITGYMPEPWHLRYIGEQAVEIYESGLTLEEYLGVEGGGYY